MNAALKNDRRMLVVLDTGTITRGNQGSAGEQNIRKNLVDADFVEAVVVLPENLSCDTTAPGIILITNRAERRPGQVLLVNASKLFSKGRPKNFLADQQVQQIAERYHGCSAEERVSAIVTEVELARNNYSLSPCRYVARNGAHEVPAPQEAIVLLRKAEEERTEADRDIEQVLRKPGLGGLSSG